MKDEIFNNCILFLNDDFVICDKPSLTLSVPDRHQSDRPCLGLYLQLKLNKNIFPVHRLDYEVSGLVMYALNAKAHKVSQDWFQSKQIEKNYSAWTLAKQDFSHWPSNIPKSDQGIYFHSDPKENIWSWKVQLLRGKRRSYESKNGDWAITKAELIQEVHSFFEWRLSPITGKPHQLRFELSRHGFPIIGDTLYGGVPLELAKNKEFIPYLNNGIALRAVRLNFTNCKDHKKWGLPNVFQL